MLATHIQALAAYAPDRKLTNADLEQLVDTSDEWIVTRTGIRERRVAEEDRYTSDLCAAAVEKLLTQKPDILSGVELVIAATHTPDYPFPGVACLLQQRFSLHQAGALDLNATYALHLADGLLAAGRHRKILVVAGDTMSKITDYTDRTTCILFGDGAGAAVLESRDTGAGSRLSEVLAAHLGSDGSMGKACYRSGLKADWQGEALQSEGCFVQNGREVYKWALSHVPEGIAELCRKAGIALQDVDWFIPHSANLRMIQAICERSGMPMERTLTSVEYNGNTSAASIPLALARGIEDGRVQRGQVLLLYGFGGGMTEAGLLLRY
ncbi:ketoacyl-ACP synthase III [Xylanibacillus composti]|uniref:Beta-ketoacyl-[acyl-carrier-protein] synthase III n=1 Tax=Xylanibacillus composti TaxID=1572762 RepID=A0A8J4M1X9_9BACL|nr:ketoacyl-ACP synthase III [Xylanibacillus composti]MDT9723424.1 ketoacyl-ACP synthase III [Xylanibacillus composti]GIQ68540.1 3-oxoacyl-[acyl-carrier-protein] synthase 3 protein 2 [Xylanibacillus composti]